MAIIVIEQQDGAAERQHLHRVTQPSLRLAALIIGRYHRFEEWRQSRAQARQLASLPMDMRKDIGWPGPDRH